MTREFTHVKGKLLPLTELLQPHIEGQTTLIRSTVSVV